MSNLTFTTRCARYAAVEFGAERVMLGVSGYAISYNETAHTAENLTIPEARARMQTYGATPSCHDSQVDDWYFTYQDEEGSRFLVYLESAAGINRRVKLAQQYGLAGIAGFYVGGESQELFDAMGKYCSSLPFTDVRAEDWFCQSIEYVYAHGLFNGVTATTFEPEENVTREQLATILYRYVSGKGIAAEGRAELGVYPDSARVDAWAREALSWAVSVGLINGTVKDGSSQTVLDPLGNATRAQVATILMRFVRNVIGQLPEQTNTA